MIKIYLNIVMLTYNCLSLLSLSVTGFHWLSLTGTLCHCTTVCHLCHCTTVSKYHCRHCHHCHHFTRQQGYRLYGHTPLIRTSMALIAPLCHCHHFTRPQCCSVVRLHGSHTALCDSHCPTSTPPPELSSITSGKE